MSDTLRFDPVCYNSMACAYRGRMEHDPDGDWVNYEDYAHLELELSSALRERDEAKAEAEQWNKFGVKHRELAQRFRNERDDARRDCCLVSKERDELREREEWHQRCHEEVSEKLVRALQQRDQAAVRANHAENALEAATAHRDEARLALEGAKNCISRLEAAVEHRDSKLEAVTNERDEALKRLESAYHAIRFAVARFGLVSFGWDGDCGSKAIIETLEDSLPESSDVSPGE